MTNGNQLHGRQTDAVAVVTGGGRGIGRAICLALAREGARAVVVAARSGEAIDAVAREVEALGAAALPVQVDVTDPLAVEAMVRQTVEQFGRLDVLVNNAGRYTPSRFLEYDPAEWRQVIEVNLHSTYYCCRAALPQMLDQGRGKVVMIASTAGKYGSLYQSAYNASKHAVLGLTKCLALETAQQGITVNAVCPGFVETDMVERAKGIFAGILGLPVEQAVEVMKARVPQRRFLQPEEVATLAVYFASPESDGVTGQAYTIDGGMILI